MSYAGENWNFTGASIGGMLATAPTALVAVGILAAFFAYPW